MTPFLFLDLAIRPAFGVLPAKMDTPNARAFLLATALQETNLSYRRQLKGGPGRSYFQFEPGPQAAIAGLLHHHRTKALLDTLCAALNVAPTKEAVYDAVEHNDVLAVFFARALLFTHPAAVPGQDQADDAWEQYLELWRPGKPRPETWAGNYATAWAAITLPPMGVLRRNLEDAP